MYKRQKTSEKDQIIIVQDHGAQCCLLNVRVASTKLGHTELCQWHNAYGVHYLPIKRSGWDPKSHRAWVECSPSQWAWVARMWFFLL